MMNHIEERLLELSQFVSWHRSQLSLAKKEKHLWKCVLTCSESGAILLEIGNLINQVQFDPKFKIRIRGEIRCIANARFNKFGKRKTDWDFDLTAPTTIFRLDEDYKYDTLKYPLYIPDLELDTVDKICDDTFDGKKEGEVEILFCLP